MNLIKDNIDLSDYMISPEGNSVRPASDWVQEVRDHFHKPQTDTRAVRLPWSKLNGVFEFRPGEVSIIGGINGHGKSIMWSQVILGLCAQGERVCLASLEMKPRLTLARMAKQAHGSSSPPISFIDKMARWSDERLWLYDKVGNCDPEKMLALIRYAKDKFNIDHFVIDNLTKVISGEDNFNGQKDFVNSLCSIASDLNIHIHLVVHVRKGASEDDAPNKMSIKGAGSIVDMADNLFIAWRNKSKERARRSGEAVGVEEPDATLTLDKQRNGEGEENEGLFLFWYDRFSNQFLEDGYARPESISAISRYMELH